MLENSTGWFIKFKLYHGLWLLKLCREKAFADVEGDEAFCEEMSELINQENITMD